MFGLQQPLREQFVPPFERKRVAGIDRQHLLQQGQCFLVANLGRGRARQQGRHVHRGFLQRLQARAQGLQLNLRRRQRIRQ